MRLELRPLVPPSGTPQNLAPISLYELETSVAGFQAQPGAIGFGYPERQLGWTETLNDGAVLTQSRYARRRLDIPIILDTSRFSTNNASNRTLLESKISQLYRLLSQPMRLYVYPNDTTNYAWYIDCYAASGASATLGEETNGVSYYRTVLSLEAPNPFFVSGSEITIPSAPSGFTVSSWNDTITIAGEAPTPVKIYWEIGVDDPQNITEVSATRNVGGVDKGPWYKVTGTAIDRVSFDPGLGTVSASNGNTRVDAQLLPKLSPGFWSTIEPGTHNYALSLAVSGGTPSYKRAVFTYRERRLGLI